MHRIHQLRISGGLNLNHILVARDLSDNSDQAVAYALDRLHTGFEAAADAAAPFAADGLQVQFAVARDVGPVPALLHYAAEQQVDLIVTGTHGRSGLARLIQGSVSEQIARSAPCPVSIVRQNGHA